VVEVESLPVNAPERESAVSLQSKHKEHKEAVAAWVICKGKVVSTAKAKASPNYVCKYVDIR